MNNSNLHLTAAPEPHVDYTVTAKLGTDAFNNPNVVLSAAQLQWFYERAFSSGTTVVAIAHEGKKVGQIAMVKQTLLIDGKQQHAAQLVDLYIEKPFRGKNALTLLYTEVERQFRSQQIGLAFGMPNNKAIGVNEHFFQLKTFLRLDVRVGISPPLIGKLAKRTVFFSPDKRNEIIDLGEEFATTSKENGLIWNGERLYNRLCTESRQYALHATENLMLISSPREKRGVKFTLLCGFLRKKDHTLKADDVRAVVNSACRFWKRPVFIFAGHNANLPILPGFPLSRRIHKSPMLLQFRNFTANQDGFKLTRFQLMDFDFA